MIVIDGCTNAQYVQPGRVYPLGTRLQPTYLPPRPQSPEEAVHW